MVEFHGHTNVPFFGGKDQVWELFWVVFSCKSCQGPKWTGGGSLGREIFHKLDTKFSGNDDWVVEVHGKRIRPKERLHRSLKPCTQHVLDIRLAISNAGSEHPLANALLSLYGCGRMDI